MNEEEEENETAANKTKEIKNNRFYKRSEKKHVNNTQTI